MHRRYVPSEPKNLKNTVGSKYPVPLEIEQNVRLLFLFRLNSNMFISLGTQYMEKLGSIIRLCTI